MSYRPYSDLTTNTINRCIRRHELAIKNDPYNAEVDEYHLPIIDAMQRELDRRSNSSGESRTESIENLREQMEGGG